MIKQAFFLMFLEVGLLKFIITNKLRLFLIRKITACEISIYPTCENIRCKRFMSKGFIHEVALNTHFTLTKLVYIDSPRKPLIASWAHSLTNIYVGTIVFLPKRKHKHQLHVRHPVVENAIKNSLTEFEIPPQYLTKPHRAGILTKHFIHRDLFTSRPRLVSESLANTNKHL